MKRFLSLVCIFMLIFAVSCSSKKKSKEEVTTEDKKDPVVKEEVAQEISAEEGGTIKNSDESISIEIPGKALENDTKITMKIYDTKNYKGTDDKDVISQIVEFEPSGTVFKKPVIITMKSLKDVENKIITAAVFREEKGKWSYSPKGAAVKIAGYDEGGDPIMQSAGGDPIMLNAGGDPIMMSAGGDPIMLSAGGDPIMITAGGDPIMHSAGGDPIMMTTGHFTAYTFFALEPKEKDGENPEDEPEETDSDSSDTDPGFPVPDDTDSGATGECEISDIYTNNYFGEYFRFKGESFINNHGERAFSFADKVTTQLYLDNEDYRFEYVYVVDEENYINANNNIYAYTDYSDREDLTLFTFTNTSTTDLYAITIIPKSEIDAGRKDPNGRVNLKSSPQVEVLYYEHYDSGSEEEWYTVCYVAVTKPSDKNGGVQLCPGENGSFDIEQTIKIGVNVELTTDEDEIIAFQKNLVDRTEYELCYTYCSINAEFDENGKCKCKNGYTWKENNKKCVEETDDTETTPDDEEESQPDND